MKYVFFSALTLAALLAGCDGGTIGNMEGTTTEVIVRQSGVSANVNGGNSAGQGSSQTNTRDLVDAAGNTLDAINGNSGAVGEPESEPTSVDADSPAQTAPKKEAGKKIVESEPVAEESEAPLAPQKMNVVKPGVESAVQKQATY